MNCPCCTSTLETIEYEGVQIETCPTCDGQWLDEGELKKIVDIRQKRFSEAEGKAVLATKPLKGVKLADVDLDLTCPKCAGITDPINYGGDTGIIIDRCPKCRGLWLDSTELDKIQILVEGWEKQLPDDLKKFGPKLARVAREVDAADDANPSRFHFINVIINRILDIVM